MSSPPGAGETIRKMAVTQTARVGAQPRAAVRGSAGLRVSTADSSRPRDPATPRPGELIFLVKGQRKFETQAKGVGVGGSSLNLFLPTPKSDFTLSL